MTVNLNGDLSQWTSGTTFAACASGQMVADGFRLHDISAAVHTVRRSADVPGWRVCGRVLPYSMEVEVTTADASLGATDLTAITYRGEGSELCYMLGGPIRVRLWMKGPTGQYNLHLSNGPETWSYSQPLVLTVADMWTRFDVWSPEIPYPDTDWYLDNRVGYTVAITLACGTSYQDEMERWISGAGLKFGGAQTNFNATVGNKLKIAGLRIGDGPLFYEAPEDVELACHRYLGKSFDRHVAPAQNLGFGGGETSMGAIGALIYSEETVRFPVPMRKPPVMTGFNPGATNAVARCQTAAVDCTNTTLDEITAYGFRASAKTPAGVSPGDNIGLHWLADASLPALGQSVGG